jgi:hypothetical protein
MQGFRRRDAVDDRADWVMSLCPQIEVVVRSDFMVTTRVIGAAGPKKYLARRRGTSYRGTK